MRVKDGFTAPASEACLSTTCVPSQTAHRALRGDLLIRHHADILTFSAASQQFPCNCRNAPRDPAARAAMRLGHLICGCICTNAALPHLR